MATHFDNDGAKDVNEAIKQVDYHRTKLEVNPAFPEKILGQYADCVFPRVQ